MDIRSTFQSAFVKECPHCGASIHIRELRKVPREQRAAWYQFTPTPHAACPHCGGFVASTIANSPWLGLLVFVLLAGAASTAFYPGVSVLAKSAWGRLGGIALVALLSWLALRQSKLEREPHGR
jgi:ribosomal protein S27AE